MGVLHHCGAGVKIQAATSWRPAVGDDTLAVDGGTLTFNGCTLTLGDGTRTVDGGTRMVEDCTLTVGGDNLMSAGDT
jgi:hypothetical protein